MSPSLDANGVMQSIYDPVNRALRVAGTTGAPAGATYILATANSSLPNAVLMVTAVNRGLDATRLLSSPVAGWVWFTSDTGINYWYSGSAWFEVSRGIAALDTRYVSLSTVTTADDLIVGTGNAAVTRLGVGGSRIVGKKATGTVSALTAAETMGVLVPVPQPVTQTYATATATVPAQTAAATTAVPTAITPWGYTTSQQATDIVTNLNALRLDHLNTTQALNAVIDALQAAGILA
jgi:hypothetical protein